VDVSLRIVLGAVLVGMLAVSVPGAAVGDHPPGDAIVESLSIEAAGQGCAIGLKFSAPIPRMTFKPAGAVAEVTLDLPDATSRLLSRYAPGPCPLSEVRVETGLNGDHGVRIRFPLAPSGAFFGLEQTGQGLVLRFAATEAAVQKDPFNLSEYRIGAGDKLEISVFGHEDLNKVVEVRGDGTINYPLIGSLEVAGKTVTQVDEQITGLLAKDFLVDPQVSVDVREYQSQWVTIIGEVRTPGRYVLKRNMRLIDLLAEAAGATKEAGTEILVTRRQDQDGHQPRQIVVNRDRLLSRDNQDANLILEHGDIVTIGEKEVYYIRGEVAKPGSYYLEKGLTILRSISVAGGLSQFANRKEVDLLREGPKGQQKIRVNLKAIEDGKKQDIPLLPNDVIIVPRRIF
jgi:polysaccharide biosynthesis/export protein